MVIDYFKTIQTIVSMNFFKFSAGMRKFRINQDFLIEHWHMSVVFAKMVE